MTQYNLVDDLSREEIERFVRMHSEFYQSSADDSPNKPSIAHSMYAIRWVLWNYERRREQLRQRAAEISARKSDTTSPDS